MRNERITVLLGAGAMLECTQISTSSLTKLVTEKEQNYLDENAKGISTYPLLAEINEDLSAYFRNDERVSFEDILHMLEMLDSYNSAQNEQIAKSFKSVFPAFTQLVPSYIPKIHLTHTAKQDLISTVIEEVGKHESGWKDKANRWFPNFFNFLGTDKKLDLFPLNYDTWLEQIFESHYCDGYSPLDEQYSSFSPMEVFSHSETLHSINHLHGQICFTSPNPTIRSKYVWENQCRLLKAKDFDLIKNQGRYPLYGGGMTATQSGEHLDSFPIITGLRKTDKIMSQPFDAYFHHFYQSILQNSRLLIIGYGFGDLYINSILRQFSSIHGQNGKAVVIDYMDKNDWIPWIYDNQAISSPAKQFCYHLFRENDLDHRFLSFERPDFIDSKDGTKSIYTLGFKKTVEQYTERMLGTLT